MVRKNNNTPKGEEDMHFVMINLAGASPSLEEQVRNALIEKRTEELLETAKLPEYNTIVQESIHVLMGNIMGVVQRRDNLDEEETAELKQDVETELMPLLTSMLTNPQQLKEIMYETAKNQYMPAQELKAMVEKTCRELKLPENLEQEYRKAYEPIFESGKESERFVGRVVEIAKKDGLARALEKESINGLVREFYPTPQDYMKSVRNSFEIAQKFTQQAQAPLMADGEAGQAGGMLTGALGAVIENLKAKHANLMELGARKKIKEIYGVDYREESK